MKILAVSKLPIGVTVENLQPHRIVELRRVWELYCSGILREVYLRKDQPGAVAILECVDVTEAKATLATLPMVEAGMVDFDVIPLGPYLSIEILFSK